MLSISGGMRRATLVCIAAGMAAALALWYFDIRRPPTPARTLRVGFENVPPVQIRTDHGPAGIAVETINEAAKRAGVSLQWVETGTSSDEAFRRGLVDLWPIMAELPDRRKTVHISKPWLHTNHTLVLRQDATPPDRGFAGRMALFKMPLHVRLARQEFPEAHLVPFAEAREIIKEVCSGAVGAGFMEFRLALSAIEDKPAECNSTTLRVVPLSDARLQLGVGSTFEAASAADRIRDKIGNMYRDGTLAATMAKYSYYGLESEWATYDLMEAAERARWMAWGLSALGIALVVTLLQLASLRQRKRSEAALRASEERFRAIFHQAAVGAAQVTLEGAVSIVNDRYCEVLGYPREELLRRRLVDTTHSDECAEALANRRRLLEGETASYSMEMRSVRKDGSIIWVKLHESLVRDGSGQPTCSIALLDDITERRQTEAALQESERRFRNMADTAPGNDLGFRPGQALQFFQPGMADLYGQHSWTGAVATAGPRRCIRMTGTLAYSLFCRVRCAAAPIQKECRLRRADGEYRWVLTTGAPRFESSGAFAGYVGSCTDITELKRTQEEALARQKLESLGVLAGGIAHDFNNLLGSILATSELVLSELPVDSPAYDGVESIKKVADRAAEIVRQMMAYAGQESTVFEPLDLSGLVNEMLQLLKVSISKRAILTVDLPENLPAVRANPRKSGRSS